MLIVTTIDCQLSWLPAEAPYWTNSNYLFNDQYKSTHRNIGTYRNKVLKCTSKAWRNNVQQNEALAAEEL